MGQLNKNISKETLEELKERLEKSRRTVQEELQGFAKKNKDIKDDWKTKYPRFNSGTGGEEAEGEADEEEEYINLLPVEHSLELRLRDINLALNKIKEGKYGICEKCGKEISEERLKAKPEAKFCRECEKK